MTTTKKKTKKSLVGVLGVAATSAALVLGGSVAANAAVVSTSTLSPAEVADQHATIQQTTELACGALVWPLNVFCAGNQANGGMADAIEDAYVSGCGLRTVTTTNPNSTGSYDRYNYEHTKVNCS
jgi:hypothetical protein